MFWGEINKQALKLSMVVWKLSGRAPSDKDKDQISQILFIIEFCQRLNQNQYQLNIC